MNNLIDKTSKIKNYIYIDYFMNLYQAYLKYIIMKKLYFTRFKDLK